MFDVVFSVGINGALIGLVYGLMALGLSVIFGVVRVVNFAHGELLVLSVFASYFLNLLFGIDPIVAAPIVALLMFALGYAIQLFLINRLLGEEEHVQFIVLAAFALILVNGMLMAFGPDSRFILADYAYESMSIGALTVDTARVYAGLVSIATTTVIFLYFKYTLSGKAIRACSDNMLGAMVVGLNYRHLYALSFGIGAACVGIAGSMLSFLIDVSPQVAPELTLLGFVIVIIGGMGNMMGALLGGVLIGVVENYASFALDPSLKSLFSFLFLIIVLLFRPQGLLAKTS